MRGLDPRIPTGTGIANEAAARCDGASADGRVKPHRHQHKAAVAQTVMRGLDPRIPTGTGIAKEAAARYDEAGGDSRDKPCPRAVGFLMAPHQRRPHLHSLAIAAHASPPAPRASISAGIPPRTVTP